MLCILHSFLFYSLCIFFDLFFSNFFFFVILLSFFFFFFFFQAEDGIRDKLVTGVQTCALPIFPKGVFNVVTCSRDNVAAVGDELISNPTVRGVSFTGSTAIGSQVAAKAGDRKSVV